MTTGFNAVMALLQTRPNDVRVLACTNGDDAGSDFRQIADRLLRQRNHAAATEVNLWASDRDLKQWARSDHHEGFVALAAPRKWTSPSAFAEQLVRTHGVAIAFDRVRNPYNIGAILRSAAFLGAHGALFGPIADVGTELLSPLAVRVAEGGAEYLSLSRTTDLSGSLEAFRRAGVRVFGAAGDTHTSYQSVSLRGPTIIVVGNEAEGLSTRVRAACDDVLAIRGSGHVESLNVGVASALFLARALSEN